MEVPTEKVGDCAIAMGNFDGVHTAHRMLLAAATRLAKQKDNCRSAVFFFDPPSSEILYPGTQLLSSLSDKLDAFRQCGIEYAYLADFASLRNTSADQFVSRVLVETCHAVDVVCGFNFRFGQGGRGGVSVLEHLLGKQHVCIMPPCCMPVRGQNVCQVISSTAIRSALSSGDIPSVRRLLGSAYRFSAPVSYGKQLGRKLGIPTINQTPPENKLLPANGVYVTRVRIGDSYTYGVTNVGTHPTVDVDAKRNCETHLLNFEGDLYGQTVTVEFLQMLRPEYRFDSVERLKKTILEDIKSAKKLLNME
jgi:riboflavin kinase/FMN adenylyltransferase